MSCQSLTDAFLVVHVLYILMSMVMLVQLVEILNTAPLYENGMYRKPITRSGGVQ